MSLDNILLIPGVDWTPRNLFRPGDNGLWQDMSNFGTLRQLSTGSTLVSSVGDPIGYIADSGSRGHLTTQTTNGKRPILSRTPEGGVRNLLQWTKQFDNAYWTKFASGTASVPVITPNDAVAPDGTATADRIVFDCGAGTTATDRTEVVRPALDRVLGQSYAGSIWLRGLSGGEQIAFRSSNGAGYQLVTLTTAWQRFSGVGVATSTGASDEFGFGIRQGQSFGTINSSATVFAWKAQREIGLAASAEQEVTTRYDITEAGKRDCWAYGTDGIDDAMSTPSSVDMSGSDEMTVCVGLRKFSDASAGYFCEFSESSSINDGTFYLVHSAASLPNYQSRSRGDVSTFATANTYVAPSSNILLFEGKISTDVNRLTVDGDTTFENTGNQGTGNFGNYRLFFGARNEASSFCNGLIYQVIIINRLLSDYEKTKLQQFVARKMGITL